MVLQATGGDGYKRQEAPVATGEKSRVAATGRNPTADNKNSLESGTATGEPLLGVSGPSLDKQTGRAHLNLWGPRRGNKGHVSQGWELSSAHATTGLCPVTSWQQLSTRGRARRHFWGQKKAEWGQRMS